MTTPKVIFSSTTPANRDYANGNVVIAASLVFAFVIGVAFTWISEPIVAIIAGAVSFVVFFIIAVFMNRHWVAKQTDFIESIKKAVERETGHMMTTRGIMAFLFSGEATDGKGTTLKVRQVKEDISVLMIK